jgi:cytochrome c
MRLFAGLAALAAPALGVASAGLAPAPGAGERAFQKCYSCHDLAAETEGLAGPSLDSVVGRRAAAEPGFDYSPALKRFAAENPVWTEPLLDRFIADPEAVVPGTSMTFTGMRDPQERAALIAYLRKHR